MKKFLISYDNGETAIVTEAELAQLKEQFSKDTFPFVVLGEILGEVDNSVRENPNNHILDELKTVISNMTDKEKADWEAKNKPWNHGIPKGWVSIDQHLPRMRARDIVNGGSIYKVKDRYNHTSESAVGDHNVWYYMAKELGITHWWNE